MALSDHDGHGELDVELGNLRSGSLLYSRGDATESRLDVTLRRGNDLIAEIAT